MINVNVKKIDPAAILPHYEHQGDAGLDVYANESCTLQPMQRKLIGTGIALAIPSGYEAQVRPKSGLALKHGIGMVNSPGTIDAPYRGELKIIVINYGQEDYEIEKGKKIAQIVFNKVEHAQIIEVNELDSTTRDQGGFGSTGEKR